MFGVCGERTSSHTISSLDIPLHPQLKPVSVPSDSVPQVLDWSPMVATLHPIRFRTVSPRPSRSSPSASASVSPPPPSRASPRRSLAKPRSSGESKENVEPLPVQMYGYAEMSASRLSKKANGKLPVSEEKEMGNGVGRTWRDGSRELSDDTDGVPRPRRTRPTKSPAYDGLPTLSTIPDSEDEASSSTSNSNNNAKPPPPAQSAAMAKNTPERPVTRKRRSSSIKRKPSPGVKPTKVVDWEIPRKTLHSSIGKGILSASRLCCRPL